MSYIGIPNGIQENESSLNLRVLNNGGMPVVVKNNSQQTEVRIMDQAGTVVTQTQITSGVLRFQDLNLNDGIYFVQCKDISGSKVVAVIQHH
jgi:hypothetical protein